MLPMLYSEKCGYLAHAAQFSVVIHETSPCIIEKFVDGPLLNDVPCTHDTSPLLSAVALAARAASALRVF